MDKIKTALPMQLGNMYNQLVCLEVETTALYIRIASMCGYPESYCEDVFNAASALKSAHMRLNAASITHTGRNLADPT